MKMQNKNCQQETTKQGDTMKHLMKNELNTLHWAFILFFNKENKRSVIPFEKDVITCLSYETVSPIRYLAYWYLLYLLVLTIIDC
jgi:hypothetical protein